MTLTEGEERQIQTFFQEKCFYHWDGKGEVPMGSAVIWALVKMGQKTHEQICQTCGNRDECAVRMDRVR